MLSVIRRLLAPPFIADRDQARRAYLLNALSWALAFALLLLILPAAWLQGRFFLPGFVWNRVLPGLVIVLVAQILLRRGHVGPGSLVFLLMTGGLVARGVWFGGGLSSPSLPLALLLVLAAGLLFDTVGAVAAAGLAAVLALLALLAGRSGRLPPPTLLNNDGAWLAALVAALAGTVLLLALLHRRHRISASAVDADHHALAERVAGLEQRAAERRRDLILTAELGRSLARIRDREALLTQAVNLIRDRFDLYYTQIYLPDPAGRFLVLQAGTGEAGRNLVGRGHRLALAATSINGRAAVERRPVIVADTEDSELFRPNPLLPHTRSEMAVPLVLGERVVGVLDLQSDRPQGLSTENLEIFAALAGQLAVAIENANLFAQMEETRREIEMQTRHLTSASWADFLDAIHRGETLSYSFGRPGGHPNEPPLDERIAPETDDNALEMSIRVAGAPIGRIRLERDDDESWTEDQQELVAAVAQQAAQQLENLRLLAEAEHYRAEAEQAIRRLTRVGWDEYYQAATSAEAGFRYDGQRVVPLAQTVPTGEPDHAPMLNQLLMIQGESVGEVTVAASLDDEQTSFVAAVAERLSAHMENLRLTAQTETALAATEEQARRLAQLNELAAALNATQELDEIFKLATGRIAEMLGGQQAEIDLVDEATGKLAPPLAGAGRRRSSVGARLAARSVSEKRLLVLPDSAADSAAELESLTAAGFRSAMVAPLIAPSGALGALTVLSRKAAAFDATAENLMRQIASLLATTIENRRLLARARRQADQERLVNTIGQKIQSTLTMESALQTAVRELGQALQARYSRVDVAADLLAAPAATASGGAGPATTPARDGSPAVDRVEPEPAAD